MKNSYLVRIELHNADWPDDYDVLHKAMTKLGFGHTIKADDGRSYRLPTAEYAATTNHTIDQVRQFAKQATEATGRKSIVLVVKYVAWAGTGMESA